MARFSGSAVIDLLRAGPDNRKPPEPDDLKDRRIGELLRDTHQLTTEQMARVLAYHLQRGLRFGESAVALGLVTPNDVLSALSQQFHYPCALDERISLSPELVTLNQPFSHQAEAVRALRSQLMMRLYADADRQSRTALAVVSPDTGDGKSFFSANLAASLAQLGGRTLLVDADLRGPRQHLLFQIDNRIGLSSLLLGRSETQVIQQVAGLPDLFVLPVGVTPPNPMELIERPAFGVLMNELVSKFDHVIVDTPAAIYGADGVAIATRCGAAVVVARKDHSRVASLQNLVATLEQTSARLAGVVFNEY